MDEPTREEIVESCFEELSDFIAAVAKGFSTDGDRLVSLAYAAESLVGIRSALGAEREASAWLADAIVPGDNGQSNYSCPPGYEPYLCETSECIPCWLTAARGTTFDE